VLVDGSKATSFSVKSNRGQTSLSTEAGVAQLRSGANVKQVAAGESAVAGVPTAPADDDGGMSGGSLAVLLLAIGGAVAAVIIAATHDNDINLNGTVTVVSPTK